MSAVSDAPGQGLVAIRVPELGDQAGPARVSSWLVSSNERVSSGDRLVELAIPGVTVNVSATNDGTVEQIVLGEGSPVTSTTVLGWIRPSEVS